ncbi:hypothetical protein DPMN_113425 [Dreissena polymorpha]|uniref:Uncharacterized protein n=1 Tax=Dreissena polymorpha TaxID=45954 RepID=A0A9D4QQU0_DREPO|nr:hypothetical protein DPMN_113425 [Dreissena polymorpha]
MAAIMIIYDYEMNHSQFNSKERVVSMYYVHQLFNLKFGGNKLRAIQRNVIASREIARQRPTRGAPGLIMGSCIVEIDRIVIRYVQYQFEVNRCNFGWAWSMWARAPQVEIDRIVIRDVQYQFEMRTRYGRHLARLNRCRNEEVIVKGNFWWAWSMWAGRPRVGNGAMHNVQYQFEVNWCRNEEVNTNRPTDQQTNRQTGQKQYFQGSSTYSVGGDSGQDGRKDRRRR